jgi:hypothetical protein
MRISLRMSKRRRLEYSFSTLLIGAVCFGISRTHRDPGDMARQSVVTPDPSLWRNSQSGPVTLRTRDLQCRVV